MGAKKKGNKGKGKAPAGRRTSTSDFAAGDAILAEIMAGSNKTATYPDAPHELVGMSTGKKKKGSTVGASLLAQISQDDDQELQDLSPRPAANGHSAITTTIATTTSSTTSMNAITEGAKEAKKCPHAKQAAKVVRLRRQMAQIKDLSKCHGCEFDMKRQIRAAKQMASMSELMERMALDQVVEPEPLSLEAAWMCLSCCEVNCGRAVKKHAVRHAESARDHSLAINLSNMECWCYECDDSIVPSKNRNQIIAEYQSTVEKELMTKQLKQRAANAALAKKTKSTVVEAKSANTIKVYTPGLQNLGNTCFFNSVVQVLAETKTLRQIMSDKAPPAIHHQDGALASGDGSDEREKETKEDDEKPKVTKKDEDGKEGEKEAEASSTAVAIAPPSSTHKVSLPPSLAATTDAGLGPLTSTFKALLHTMWKQQGATVTPRDLFTQITKRWKVFRGFRQQDSQELMRYLFDGLEQEELDLVKRHVAEQQQNHHQEQASDIDKTRKMKGKKGGQGAGSVAKYAPFIDSCFSGKLVSVIVCDACKKCSYSYEPYFDLSLPVKSVRGVGPSSGTSMRDKLRARALGNHHALSETATITSVDSETTLVDKEQQQQEEKAKDAVPAAEQGSSAHIEHVQRLLKTIEPPKSMDALSIERSLVQFTAVDLLDDDNKFACENCYKILRASSGDQKSESEEESAKEEEQEKEEEKEEEQQKDEDEEKEEKEEKEEVAEKMGVAQEEGVEQEDKKAEGGESTEEADKDISEEESKMEVDAAESEDESEDESEELTDSLGNTIERPSKKKTAATPVISSAAAAAAAVAKAGKESKPKAPEPKYLMRKAYKRYLVATLPPTLVLHLKRFETAGSRFGMMRKIDDHVEIPEELDMSPFCIPKKVIEEEDEPKKGGDDDDDEEENKDEPEEVAVEVEDQENVSKKYRLYGVVVHQGTLGNGHYTNYVLSSKVEDLNAKVEAMNKAAAAASASSSSSSAAAANSGSSSAMMPDIPLSELLAQQQAKKKGGKKGKGVAVADSAATAPAASAVAGGTAAAACETVPVEENAVEKRKWLYCSDTHVRLSSLEEALASNAYLLFYERI
ncbi:Ubiquitin carboxyl-terminal hydrolase 16 [Actinomortierella ambigua]|uniref:ubiquitinyl hydrolase 1 n=1 Tax=Actinomortierella ambigua TaxID=1343610 RepID=A0A9P6Q1Y6_9FUNG|nr:Ubiquitin carboxyl-terminal hydrolase 16 [Actinomortierella ambigua]